MSASQERLYLYYKRKILALLRRLAQTAKTKDDICEELRVLRSTLAGLGGAQMDKEKKQELKSLIDDALKTGGCV